MQTYGRTSVSEFLGDLIVYRNLKPVDARLPGLADLRAEIGIPANVTPRKSEREYARVMALLLRAARALDAPSTSLARIVYVGDTRLLDQTAFTYLCKATRCPGMAFIGSETGDDPAVEMEEIDAGTIFQANRWELLSDFDALCRDYDFRIDRRTAVVIDLDKTTLGARGRNDAQIDAARVAAVRRTVDALLGEAFRPGVFQAAYETLNRPEFHPFTGDNQDYLAYVCLIVSSGLVRLGPLVNDVRDGTLTDFAHFIAEVDARAADLPADLRALHSDIAARVQQGDPTPFKAFRYNEYRETVGRMGQMDDAASAADLLAGEIVITQEVREMALKWRDQGALLFGLSDKPDEASLPPADLAAQGYQPIHRTVTHAAGAG
ncbi:MAG TPA: hypothetical protein PKH77_17615 [Anaerolineae bacterium]|nr:hypothetical protein [Anaerolineae bacterium]